MMDLQDLIILGLIVTIWLGENQLNNAPIAQSRWHSPIAATLQIAQSRWHSPIATIPIDSIAPMYNVIRMDNGVTGMLEVRPHGANNKLGNLPASNMSAALNLHRIFGGAIVDTVTGVDYTPAPRSKGD